MIGEFFWRKTERNYPKFLYRLALEMFAVVHNWEPFVSGPRRGRLFEEIFYGYCRHRGLLLSEESGSRTIRQQHSASGFRHESDAVIVKPDLTLHLELKYLSKEVTKDALFVFHQKGFDFLASANATLRSLPFYRILLSGGVLTPEARIFALQWGILTVEPDRMPLLLLHWLAGHCIPDLPQFSRDNADEIWIEVPTFVVPLQERWRRLPMLLDGQEQLLSPLRIDRMARIFQQRCGDEYWSVLDVHEPNWLWRVYAGLGLRDSRISSIARSHAGAASQEF